jgi:hypothetical protein
MYVQSFQNFYQDLARLDYRRDNTRDTIIPIASFNLVAFRDRGLAELDRVNVPCGIPLPQMAVGLDDVVTAALLVELEFVGTVGAAL